MAARAPGLQAGQLLGRAGLRGQSFRGGNRWPASCSRLEARFAFKGETNLARCAPSGATSRVVLSPSYGSRTLSRFARLQSLLATVVWQRPSLKTLDAVTSAWGAALLSWGAPSLRFGGATRACSVGERLSPCGARALAQATQGVGGVSIPRGVQTAWTRPRAAPLGQAVPDLHGPRPFCPTGLGQILPHGAGPAVAVPAHHHTEGTPVRSLPEPQPR